MLKTRHPAVAGTFYPREPRELEAAVGGLLSGVTGSAADAAEVAGVKALIVPHAGYVYSGPIAASAYRCLGARAERIRRVVLLGPAHRVALTGMALPSVVGFETPVGTVPIDRASVARALQLPLTQLSDAAHAREHCLEVQLPFLQALLSEFELVPIVVGHCPPAAVAAVLDALWGGPETLIVVSSDLSHYLTYAEAVARDAATTGAILERSTSLVGAEACGASAINGLMVAARSHHLRVTALDVRNSGDTAGDRREVVGYGAFALA